MTLVEVAALAAAVLLAAVVVFSSRSRWGHRSARRPVRGRASTVDGVLEPPYRMVAIGSAVVLVVAAWIVLGRAGVLPTLLDDQVLVWTSWAVAGFMVLNTVSNLSGRHPLERWGMASITLVAALLIGYVAYSAPA